MRKWKVVLVLLILFVVGACSNKDDADRTNENDEEQVGYAIVGGSIEEAENVPEEEAHALKEAFNEYIVSFNDKDIDRYMELISNEYDKEEERSFLMTHFENFEQEREPSDVTIVKYSEEEAQLFAVIDNRLKQKSTGLETKDRNRQITVFIKEDGQWKIKSVHSVGESGEK